MGEVVSMNAAKFSVKIKEKQPELATGPIRCLNCKSEWVGTAQRGNPLVQALECPVCGHFKGYMPFKYEPKTDENDEYVTFDCACGNYLYMILPDGPFCPNCGLYVEFV